jgi:hypothetical protein
MSNTQTHKIFTEDPIFLLEINKSGLPVKIDLNGMEVYLDKSRHQNHVVHPLNNLITSGKNQLDIWVMAPKYLEYTIPNDAVIEATLIVQDASGEKHIIDNISYRHGDAAPLSGSTNAGKYLFSDERFTKNDSGEVQIGVIGISKLQTHSGVKLGGLKLSQTVKIDTPFRRWKFLDSEDIIEQDFGTMSIEQYEALNETVLIKELIGAYNQIHAGLKSKNIDSIIDLFDERLEDMDTAFYYGKGQTKEGFFNTLQDKVNSDVELLDMKLGKHSLVVEANRKVAYFYKAIRFKYKDGSGFTTYSIKFRRENGKWVITR